MAARAKVLVAKHSFTCDVGGSQVTVHGGAKLRSTHPVVKGREAFFDELKDVDVDTPRARRKARAKKA